ncbi:hypothetical protein BHE74_00056473, partial [Ensete ventricosum]
TVRKEAKSATSRVGRDDGGIWGEEESKDITNISRMVDEEGKLGGEISLSLPREEQLTLGTPLSIHAVVESFAGE